MRRVGEFYLRLHTNGGLEVLTPAYSGQTMASAEINGRRSSISSWLSTMG
jgi:hypothetical protein